MTVVIVAFEYIGRSIDQIYRTEVVSF